MAPTKKPLRTVSESTDGESDVPGVRVLALRKERSRDAARSRRSRENVQYLELAKLLPLPAAITSQLDKASVIRLTISFLKFRNLENGAKVKKEEDSETQLLPGRGGPAVLEKDAGIHLLQALDGFLFSVSSSGKFLYVSETVSTYLGLSQVELIGSSIFNYIHDDDQVQFSKLLNDAMNTQTEGEDEVSEGPSSSQAEVGKSHRTIKSFMRMKCALVKRGGTYTKTMGFKVIQIVGRIVPYKSKVPGEKSQFALVAVGNPLPLPTVCELRVQSHAFISRVGLDLKIVFCEGNINRFMDFRARDIVGLSAYEFYHLDDMSSIQVSHNQCVKAGQTVTSAYRWMNKSGGWVWMLTHATIVKRNSEDGTEEFQILCVNHVISDVEHKGVVMHGIQSYFANKREAITGVGVDFDDCELSSEKRKTTVPLAEDTSPPVRDDSLMDDILSDTSLNDEGFPSPIMFDDEGSPDATTPFDFDTPVNNNNEVKNSAPQSISEIDPIATDLFSAVGLPEVDSRTMNLGVDDNAGKVDFVASSADGNYWNNLFGEDTSLVEELMAELQRVEDESYGFNPKYEGFSSCQQSRVPQPIVPSIMQGPITSFTSLPRRQPTSTITRGQAASASVPQNRVVNSQFSPYPSRIDQELPDNNGMNGMNGMNRQGFVQNVLPTTPNGNVVVKSNGVVYDNRLGVMNTKNEPRTPLPCLPGNQTTSNGPTKANGINESENKLFNARFNDLTLRNNANYNAGQLQPRLDLIPQARELKALNQLHSLPEFQGRPVQMMDQGGKLPPPYQELSGAAQIPPPLRHFSFSPTVNWIAP